MEPSLRALKVADLRRILATAAAPAPARATKADLVARILASQQAIDAFHSLYPPPKQPTPPPDPPSPSDTQPAPPIDPELEKRIKRAERFGIPLVDVKRPAADDAEKLHVRAERFGVDASAGRKRPAPTEVVDGAELERRRKRAERFGPSKGVP